MIAVQTWYYKNIIISLKFDPAEFSLSICKLWSHHKHLNMSWHLTTVIPSGYFPCVFCYFISYSAISWSCCMKTNYSDHSHPVTARKSQQSRSVYSYFKYSVYCFLAVMESFWVPEFFLVTNQWQLSIGKSQFCQQKALTWERKPLC